MYVNTSQVGLLVGPIPIYRMCSLTIERVLYVYKHVAGGIASGSERLGQDVAAAQVREYLWPRVAEVYREHILL